MGAQARQPAVVSKEATAFLLPFREILTFADKEEATPRSRSQQGKFGQGVRVTADAFLVLPGSRKSIIFVAPQRMRHHPKGKTGHWQGSFRVPAL